MTGWRTASPVSRESLGPAVNGYLDWADTRGVSVIGWTWTVFDCSQGQVIMITTMLARPR